MATFPDPFAEGDGFELYQGDSLPLLHAAAGSSVGGIVTDPPYSSGGFTRGDRQRPPSEKYLNSESKREYHEFGGDSRDARGMLAWCSLWLAEAWRVTRSGGVCIVFADWRQLPLMTDALQCGGWVWRGVVPWDKTEASRPNVGRFRAQCEFIVWGSKGAMVGEGECFPGLFTAAVDREKKHLTAKPVALMKPLVKMAAIHSSGLPILDPFMGSGSTLAAALSLGVGCIGFEQSPEYCDVARSRLLNTAGPAEQKGLF